MLKPTSLRSLTMLISLILAYLNLNNHSTSQLSETLNKHNEAGKISEMNEERLLTEMPPCVNVIGEADAKREDSLNYLLSNFILYFLIHTTSRGVATAVGSSQKIQLY